MKLRHSIGNHGWRAKRARTFPLSQSLDMGHGVLD
jgi:hypothetical protein